MHADNHSRQETVDLFRLAVDLQDSLPYEGAPAHLTTSAERLFANDAMFQNSLTAAVMQTPRPARGKAAMGLIVGNGYIESILPELPINAVTMLDKEPDVHAWQRHCGRLLLQSDGPMKYQIGMNPEASSFNQDLNNIAEKNSWVRINRYHYEQKPWEYPVPKLLASNIASMGNYHFMIDDFRFSRCQEACIRTPITYATADISDPEKMTGIGQAIRGANSEITYLNLTNVEEYIYDQAGWENFQEALGALPLHDNVFIAHSSCTVMRPGGEYGGSTTPPLANWTNGLSSYIDFCKATPHPMFGSYRG